MKILSVTLAIVLTLVVGMLLLVDNRPGDGAAGDPLPTHMDRIAPNAPESTAAAVGEPGERHRVDPASVTRKQGEADTPETGFNPYGIPDRKALDARHLKPAPLAMQARAASLWLHTVDSMQVRLRNLLADQNDSGLTELFLESELRRDIALWRAAAAEAQAGRALLRICSKAEQSETDGRYTLGFDSGESIYGQKVTVLAVPDAEQQPELQAQHEQIQELKQALLADLCIDINSRSQPERQRIMEEFKRTAQLPGLDERVAPQLRYLIVMDEQRAVFDWKR